LPEVKCKWGRKAAKETRAEVGRRVGSSSCVGSTGY